MFKAYTHHKLLAFFLFTMAFWLSAFYVIDFYSTLSQNHNHKLQQQSVLKEVALIRAQIESEIYKEVSLADALTTSLMVNTESTLQHWDKIAQKLVNNSTYVRNIGLYPNDVISHIYPLKGNEAAIGINFRNIPKQYQAIVHTRNSGNVYLDGPISLVQGGQAVIARFPIFLDYPINKEYWGGASVVLNLEQLINNSGISNVKNADIALKRVNLDGDDQVFFGDSRLFQIADEFVPIFLPQSKWTMAVRYRSDTQSSLFSVDQRIYILGFGASGILYIAFLMLFHAYTLAHYASIQDELTHLNNRRHFFQFLEKIRFETTKNQGFTLFSIDLNDFKSINDNYGHEAGDRLLKHVAKRLSEATNDHGCLARLGGDEFAIISTKISTQEAADAFAQNIEKDILENELKWKKKSLYASVSIGYAVFEQGNDDTIEALLSKADRKMYDHKQKYYHRKEFPGGHHDYII